MYFFFTDIYIYIYFFLVCVLGRPDKIDNRSSVMRESATIKHNHVAECNKQQPETYTNAKKTPTNPRKQHPSKVKHTTESHHDHTTHC